nr:MAK10-like protein [Tanacetum cinerariifolium]
METRIAPMQPIQVNKITLYVRSAVAPTTLSTTWKIPSKLLLNMHPRVLKKREVSGGKLRDKNAKESWALLEDLALYENESWKDPWDFAKPLKVISLPQDVPSTSDRRLIELKYHVQHLMEAHLAPKQPVQLNKITSSCEICNGSYDTQYCKENPKQAFVEYASSRTNEVGDFVHQKAIMELAVQFDNASTAKDDLRKAYEKCNDIPQKSRALIDTFLKQESDKDYKMHLAMNTFVCMAAKIEKQTNTKFVWLWEKYN